jgi:hypothetical protein
LQVGKFVQLRQQVLLDIGIELGDQGLNLRASDEGAEVADYLALGGV